MDKYKLDDNRTMYMEEGWYRGGSDHNEGEGQEVLLEKVTTNLGFEVWIVACQVEKAFK